MIYLLLLLLILALLGSLLAAGEKPECHPDLISPRELAGIWRRPMPGAFVGYLYFTSGGAVYYMASRIPVTEDMFTDKYKIADFCSSCTFSSWEYAARRKDTGEVLLSVSGKAIGGTYSKVL